MYFLLGLFNRAAQVTACGGEISARCETAKRGSAALVQPRDQLAAFRQQMQELFARTHERFKPLAFLAAQLNQVFLTAISFPSCATTEIQKNVPESMTLLANKNRADSSNGDNTADSNGGSSKDDNTADSNDGSNKGDNMVDSNGGNKVGGSSADNDSRPFVCRRSRRAARAKAMRA
jgi:hypothetical protein